MISVVRPIVNDTRCNTSIAPVLKVTVLVPSVICTLPGLLFFAILIVITEPIGT